MNCPYCGEKLEDETQKFCTSCGAKLPEKVSSTQISSQQITSEKPNAASKSQVDQSLSETASKESVEFQEQSYEKRSGAFVIISFCLAVFAFIFARIMLNIFYAMDTSNEILYGIAIGLPALANVIGLFLGILSNVYFRRSRNHSNFKLVRWGSVFSVIAIVMNAFGGLIAFYLAYWGGLIS